MNVEQDINREEEAIPFHGNWQEVIYLKKMD